MTIGHFLGGVAALIYDPASSKYLILRRSESKDFLSGDWECITGRVEQGESYLQALHREVSEEIGIEIQIEFFIGVTHFYRGKNIPNNELLGVVFSCLTDKPEEVHFGEEHSEMHWIAADEAAEIITANHWLAKVIARAEKIRKWLPEELRSDFLLNGFDLP